MGEVPLKAVYKDCVVGLRYAVSHEAGAVSFDHVGLTFHLHAHSGSLFLEKKKMKIEKVTDFDEGGDVVE